jgi:hypothetical protein
MNGFRLDQVPDLAWAILLVVAAACPPALSAGDADARYAQERAVCLGGQANQDRDTCLKEAAAARDEARRGELGNGPAPYADNAGRRCDALPAAERGDCQARMQGQGTTSGSVGAGGIYRELVTREPAVAPAPADAGPEPVR